jgi:hypothetical protein
MPLFRDSHEDVRLERWAPHSPIELALPGGAEILVIDGNFVEAGERFTPQSWLRLPAKATFRATAGVEEYRIWVKTGHLAGTITFTAWSKR